MKNPLNSEKLKIPAFLRKKDLAVRAQKQLLLTALDRKRADKIAQTKTKKTHLPISSTPRKISPLSEQVKPQKTIIKLASIGKIIAYYPKIEVAIIELTGTIKLGDILQLTAQNFLFQQPIESMQIDRKDVRMAKKSQTIGLKVAFPPQTETQAYKMLA